VVPIGNFTPEGVDDTNYLDCEKKEAMQAVIRQVLKSYGYQQIMTPTFEYYDLFQNIDTAIDKDQMYKLIDSNGKILVLRPDATIPIARMAALSSESGKDYKKYMYFTNVFRSEDFRAGGRREFLQAGVEYMGNANCEADAEVVATAVKALLATGFSNIRVDLGNVNYFNGLLDELNISDMGKGVLRHLVESKNFAELEKFLERIETDDSIKKVVLALPFLYGDFKKTVSKARKIARNNRMHQAINNICEIYDILEAYGYASFVYADMGFVNALDYYSGMIFKVYLGNMGAPAASGGRYDGLVEKFGRKIPATGFGLNIDGIYEAALKEDIWDHGTNKADYAVFCTKDTMAQGIIKAEALRKTGSSVLLYVDKKPEQVKVKKSIVIDQSY